MNIYTNSTFDIEFFLNQQTLEFLITPLGAIHLSNKMALNTRYYTIN